MVQFMLQVRIVHAIIICTWQHPLWLQFFPLEHKPVWYRRHIMCLWFLFILLTNFIYFKEEKRTSKRELKQKGMFTLLFLRYNTNQDIKHSYQLSDHFCLFVLKFLLWDGKHSSNPEGIPSMPGFCLFDCFCCCCFMCLF